ncbi:MAG: helix-turn-helix transcriptional regulator [Acidimicrobiales bacterium]
MSTVTDVLSDELITISEARELLRCSERTIRRQIKEGSMPGLVRIGMRVYRINRAKLLAGEQVTS